MFSTTLPSLTVCEGTCTPGWPASTSRCGVMSLSEIHSYSARNKYGRWLVICAASSVMPLRGLPATMDSRRHRPEVFFLRRQAAGKSRIPEDAVAVILDRLAVLRQAHAKRIQPPDDRRHRAISQAH